MMNFTGILFELARLDQVLLTAYLKATAARSTLPLGGGAGGSTVKMTPKTRWLPSDQFHRRLTEEPPPPFWCCSSLIGKADARASVFVLGDFWFPKTSVHPGVIGRTRTQQQ